MPRQRLEGIATTGALVGGAAILFYLGFFLAQPLLRTVLSRMPENYEHLARRHLEQGRFVPALEACQREIDRYRYNFHAHYLCAEILHRAGRCSETLQLLLELPALHRAVLGRSDIPSRGWDEARLHLLLAEVLWDLGRYEEALDQLQLAVDWRDPEVDARCEAFANRVRQTGNDRVAAWALIASVIVENAPQIGAIPEQTLFKRHKPPTGFYTRLLQIALSRGLLPTACTFDGKEMIYNPRELPSIMSHRLFLDRTPIPPSRNAQNRRNILEYESEKATLGRLVFDTPTTSARYSADRHWARLRRTTLAPGQATVKAQSRGVCIIARGTICDDVWPIVSFHVGDQSVGQRYIRSADYQVYTLPLVLQPGTHAVAVGFENDAYNNITGRDRNLEIREIRFY